MNCVHQYAASYAGIDRGPGPGPGEGRGSPFSRAPAPAKRRSNPDVAGAGVDVISRDRRNITIRETALF